MELKKKSISNHPLNTAKGEWTRMHKLFFEQSPIAIEVYDCDGSLVDANKKCLELFGVVDISDVLGFKLFKDPNLPDNAIEKLLSNQSVHYVSKFDFDLVRQNKLYETTKSGQSFFSVNITPLRSSSGPLEGYIVQITDVTEYKLAEATLDENIAQLNTIIESLPFDVYVLDTNGRFFLQNKKCKENWGDAIGLRLEELDVNDETKKIWLNNYKRVCAGEVINEEVTYEIKGKKKRLTNIISPIYFQNKLKGIVGINIDITDQYKVEKKLIDSEKKFQRLVNNISDTLVEMDMNGELLYVSPQFFGISGYHPEEIINRNALDFVHPDDLELVYNTMTKAIDQKSILDIEYRSRNKDGGYYPIAARGSILQDGENVKFIGTVRDISERKRMEDALKESEKKYRSLAEQSRIGLIIAQGYPPKIVYANNAIGNIIGYSTEEMLSFSLQDMLTRLHPDDIGLFQSRYSSRVKGENVPEITELRGIAKNGEIHWLEFMTSIVEYNGEPAVQTAFIDITERKKAEEALKRSEKKYRDLVDNALVGVYKTNLNGELLFVNDALVKLFEFESREEMLNDSVLTRYYNKERRDDLISALKKYGNVNDFEIAALTKSGNMKHIMISASIDGDTISGMATDITERKAALEQLKKYQEQLEDLVENRTKQLRETNEELEAFAYSVSHDLRAPLRTMHGFADALLENYSDRLDSDGLEFTQRIKNASVHMNNMIQDLLEYSLVSRGEIELTEICLENIFNDVLLELEPKIKENNAKINISSILPNVLGNKTILQKVITNLISNAIKFVPDGKKPRIKIWSEKVDGRCKIYIKDNGIGISPKYHDKIFRIFERLHGIESFAGTGVGLAIVRKGMERLYGSVGVESRLGSGSTFWIELKDKNL